MVCDSTFLIDDQTNESPKLDTLIEILFEKLDIQNTDRKIIIFSEWVNVHKLIGQVLRENKVGFVELTGKVPVQLRGELIKKFETQPECKIFLSTEAGGTGLNLQVADILINFELPWNPAKKKQRIGRIDRLGQKSEKLTIYNFVTRNSIEQQIAAGLLVKQNLFEGVLDSESNTNYVDFSSKGRSQFIKQLEEFIGIDNDELLDTETLEISNEAQTDSNYTTQPDLFEDLNNEFAQEEEEEEEYEETEENIQNGDEGTQELSQSKDEPSQAKDKKFSTEQQVAEMEQVMNNGMQFLAGLFKMSIGKDMYLDNQKIEIDKETGEVVMRFKMKF